MPTIEPRFPARPSHTSLHHFPSKDGLRSRSTSAERYRLPLGPSIATRFGRRLLDLRCKRGMTQAALAAHLGLDRSYLSDVERGKKNMSLNYLETIAQGFNMTLAELLTDV